MSHSEYQQPDLKQLIEANTLHFGPKQPVVLSNQDFDDVKQWLQEVSHDDWYVQSSQQDEDKSVLNLYFRLSSHQMVGLTISKNGFVYTLFMRRQTALRYVEKIALIINRNHQAKTD